MLFYFEQWIESIGFHLVPLFPFANRAYNRSEFWFQIELAGSIVCQRATSGGLQLD